MITINLLSNTTYLPLPGRSIQLVFTDTVFGWFRPGPTDERGVTQIPTSPGPARVYVDGEFVKEYCLKKITDIYLEEANDLMQARTQVQQPPKEQAVPTLLTLESEQEVRA